MESRPDALRGRTPQESEAGLGGAPGKGFCSQGTGTVERCRIQPLPNVVEAADPVLTGHQQGEAAQSCSRALLTADTKRLAVLKREDPVGRPAAQDGILDAPALG